MSGSCCDQPPPTVCRWSCALLTTRVLGTPTTGETSVSAGVQGGGGRGSTGSPGRLLTTLPSPCSPGLHAGGRPGPPPAPAPLRPEPVGCPPWLLLHAREALPETRAAPDGEGGAGEGHVPQRGSQHPPPQVKGEGLGCTVPPGNPQVFRGHSTQLPACGKGEMET